MCLMSVEFLLGTEKSYKASQIETSRVDGSPDTVMNPSRPKPERIPDHVAVQPPIEFTQEEDGNEKGPSGILTTKDDEQNSGEETIGGRDMSNGSSKSNPQQPLIQPIINKSNKYTKNKKQHSNQKQAKEVVEKETTDLNEIKDGDKKRQKIEIPMNLAIPPSTDDHDREIRDIIKGSASTDKTPHAKPRRQKSDKKSDKTKKQSRKDERRKQRKEKKLKKMNDKKKRISDRNDEKKIRKSSQEKKKMKPVVIGRAETGKENNANGQDQASSGESEIQTEILPDEVHTPPAPDTQNTGRVNLIVS